jgi:hypothetical protein
MLHTRQKQQGMKEPHQSINPTVLINPERQAQWIITANQGYRLSY